MIKTFATLSALALLAVAMPAGADSDSAQYLTPTTPGIALQISNFPQDGSHIGGANFAAHATAPIAVEIADVSGEPVSYTVCQDTTGDGVCLDGEPSVFGCGVYVDLSLSPVAFVADAELTVFVSITDVGCGVATSGTITVEYA